MFLTGICLFRDSLSTLLHTVVYTDYAKVSCIPSNSVFFYIILSSLFCFLATQTRKTLSFFFEKERQRHLTALQKHLVYARRGVKVVDNSRERVIGGLEGLE